MKIKLLNSPNYSRNSRPKKSIKFIIIHYTGMQSEIESVRRLLNKRSKVSCHYLINRKGEIFNMVPDKRIAWHAGKSRWKKFKNLNESSIGIELVNKGHNFGYQNFTKLQIASLIKLCKKLKKKYNIKKSNLLGHSDIAINRKLDPGEKFPWKILSKHKLCRWHKIPSFKLKKLRKIKTSTEEKKRFFICIKKIGYFFNIRNSKEKFLVTKIFQMRFRQELINGKIDQEIFQIAKYLSDS